MTADSATANSCCSIKTDLLKTNQTLFINARTDAFLQKLPAPLETTLKRAQLYKDAGADCIFVTAVPDVETVKAITSSVTLPVNIVATPAFSSFELCKACGVKRISMAVLLYKKTYNHLFEIAEKISRENMLEMLYQGGN